MLVCCGALAFGGPASAEESPRVPEEVAEYFAAGVIPRLADLYGPNAGGEWGIEFDGTTVVGPISRVSVWTEEFAAGGSTQTPVQLTNDWVAPITVGEGEQAGLATVWISPNTDLPELAKFEPSTELGPALAKAPEGSVLVHDELRSAWFALTDDKLVTLVAGTTGIDGSPISLDDAQAFLQQDPVASPPQSNGGFVVAGLTLGFVVVLLAIFVLIPDHKRIALDPEVELGFNSRD